jgi:hypothetical protein
MGLDEQFQRAREWVLFACAYSLLH